MEARGGQRLRTGGAAELLGVKYLFIVLLFVLMFEGLAGGAYGGTGGSVDLQNGYYNI